MILVVSSSDDVHARIVVRALAARGIEAEIVDMCELGAGASLRFDPRHPARSRWQRADGSIVDLGRVRAVWCRRSAAPKSDPRVRDAADRDFIARQWSDAVWGTVMGLGVPLVSDPYAQRAATKPYQLALAHRIGLRVPDTIVTNDRDAFEAMLVRCDRRIVHKILAVSYHEFLYTKAWDEGDREALDDLELAPMIAQGIVGGAGELRVTVVGERIFAARFEHAGHIDGRLDTTAIYRPYQLDDTTARRLRELVARLGLRYATVDFALEADGTPVFLDLNPQGQYLFVELRTGQPITEAVADLLCEAAGLSVSAARSSTSAHGERADVAGAGA